MPLERSWTDPYFNHTSIAGLELGADLPHLLGVGTTSPELLLSLTHEGAHHMTFASPVGLSIAFLNSRARRQALATLDGQDQDYALALSYLGKKLTTEMLRPLAEGIALCAEFDVLNRRSEFISNLFMSIGRSFAPPEMQEDPRLVAVPASAALVRARSTDTGVRRKLTVYADRLHGSDTGYLLGYLSVRSMMRTLWRAWSMLIDEGDLCLAFIRAYVYADLELVDLLLAPSENEMTYISDLRSRISERLWRIDEVTEADVRRYEELIAAGIPEWDSAYADCLHFDAVRAARGIERAQRLAEELETPLAISDPELVEDAAVLAMVDGDLLTGRSFVCLGSDAVDVRVRNGRCDVKKGGVTLLTGLPSLSAPLDASGQLDVFYDPSSAMSTRIVHVTAPGTIALAVEGREWSEFTDERFQPRLSRATARAASSAFDELVRQVLTAKWTAIAAKHFLDQLPSVVDGLYEDVALRFADPAQRETLVASLSAGGIKGLLDGDRSLAEALVVAGIAAQRLPMRAGVDGALSAHGLEPGLFEELVRRGASGLPLAWASGETAVTFV